MKYIQRLGCLLLPILLLAIPLEVKYGSQFAKTSANPIYERAKSYADQGKFKTAILNYGNFVDHWQGDVAGAWGDYQYLANVSFMIGVPGSDKDGNAYPWANRPHPTNPNDTIYWGSTVSESWLDRTGNQINTDWDVVVGSKGTTFSGDITAGDYAAPTWTDENDTWPLLATSIAPESWPERENSEGEMERFWPGWYAVDTDPSSPTFGEQVNGRFTSDVDIYLEFDDAYANREPVSAYTGYPTGSRVYATVHSYGRAYAEDIMFVTMKVVNESDKYGLNNGAGFNYKGTYCGFYFDADMFSAYYFGGNRPCSTNDGDMMGYNATYDYAFIYDLDLEECSGAYDVDAFVAVKLLDTPFASDTVWTSATQYIAPGEELGLTDWHWFDWYNRPGVVNKEGSGGPFIGDGTQPESPKKEELMYQLMSGDTTGLTDREDDWFFHENNNGTLNPHYDSMEGLLTEYPDGLDCVCMMSAGPFDFNVGDTAMFSFAVIMGENIPDLNRNANMAQIMYDLRYQGFSAPQAPTVSAVSEWDAAKEEIAVRIVWDDAAENSTDIVTGYADFQGYRLYKSTDGGQTWGDPIYDVNQTQVGFKPLAQYDLTYAQDIARYGRDVSGPDPMAPWMNLGTNTGLQHEYLDENVQVGKEYTYAVTAYDIGIEPGFTIEISSEEILDVSSGITYEVIKYDTTWSTTNVDNQWSTYSLESLENPKGTTPLSPQFVRITPSRYPIDIKAHIDLVPSDSTVGNTETLIRIAEPANVTDHEYKITISATPATTTGPNIKNPKYTVIDITTNSILVNNLANNDINPNVVTNYRPIFDGLQVVFDNIERAQVDSVEWASKQKYIETAPWSTLPYPPASDYAIIFGAADEVLDTVRWNSPFAFRPAPFKAIRLPGGERVPMLVLEDGFSRDDTLNYRDDIAFFEMSVPGRPVGISVPTWMFEFTWDTSLVSATGYPFTAGDTLYFRTHKPFENGDEFTFTAADFSEDIGLTEDDLARIKVVPNPYLVSAQWEQSQYTKKLLFTNLPSECTIKIYTLTGEFVKMVEHDNPYDDSEAWDLTTINRQEVAPGLYVFAVELPDGKKHIGKFAIIR
ncbi:MAG: hypothetical protein K9N05_02970 [Candidatus Marinimicrobia bacterium]|nr:hypothetical protein [Candidatus Neomarinimicrobiota bacterium]